MRPINVIVLLTVSGLVLAGFLGHSLAQPAGAGAAPASTRVGVCDVANVFNNYQRAKDLSSVFGERAKKLADEDERRKSAIAQKEKELEGYRVGSKQYEDKLGEAEKLAMERQVWLNSQKNVNAREHRRLTEEMYKEVLDCLAAVAKEKGFDLVLHRESVDLTSETTTELLSKIAQRKCLYASPSIDVTTPVLDRLNQQYKAGAK